VKEAAWLEAAAKASKRPALRVLREVMGSGSNV